MINDLLKFKIYYCYYNLFFIPLYKLDKNDGRHVIRSCEDHCPWCLYRICGVWCHLTFRI